MNTKEKLDKILDELAGYPFTKAIYLFGSYAKGRNTNISDIDICVIDDYVNYPEKQRREIYIYSEYPFDVSLFSDLPISIKYAVLKGKCVVLKDRDFLIDVKTRTLNEYLDVKPILDEGLRIRKSAGHRVII